MTSWAEGFGDRARRHWTPERLAGLMGGKQLWLRPDRDFALLRSMGVLDKHARMQPTRVRKYRQINHMLSFLVPALRELADPVHVVDAGCGRSALGFLVAWWMLREGRSAQVLGIDSNPDVIEGCRVRAAQAELPMSFANAPLQDVDLDGLWRDAFAVPLKLGALLALHACDLATDHALALAVHHDAAFFAVAPCCQAELSRAWSRQEGAPLGPLQQNPHLRREFAALTTDAMRAALMAEAGFRVRTVEFVEAHHTPKNRLIYGTASATRSEDAGSYGRLVEATGGCEISLRALLGSVAG